MQIKTQLSCVKKSNGKLLRTSEGPISLLDKLLNGGLVIPNTIYNAWFENSEHRPVVLLITGCPGSGKTTLALELAYRWALQDYRHGSTKIPLQTLYISSESPARVLIESKAGAFKWESHIFKPIDDDSALRNLVQGVGWVAVCGTDRFEREKTASAEEFFKLLWEDWNEITNRPMQRLPALVVIDSLNVLPDTDAQRRTFLECLIKSQGGPLVLAMVFDGTLKNPQRGFWEYAADMVIEMNIADFHVGPTQASYKLGTLEILKARWQNHAVGIHQIKICSGASENDRHFPPQKREQNQGGERVPPLLPYLEDGGIHVFQSVHRYLSERAGRHGTKPVEYQPTPLENLNNLISNDPPGGFPKGRCTGIVGVRGGLKSHMAYYWLLREARAEENQAENEKKGSLLISLRDDESAALHRLKEIANYQLGDPELPDKLRKADLLRIVYLRPGYIAPNEFLYRLWFHIAEFRPQRVVINSFEQLGSMFPLCNAQPAFVPAIIDVLWAEEITSIVIGVLPEAAPSGEIGYGLLPVSDLVLRFDRKVVPKNVLDKLYIGREKFQGKVPAKSREMVIEVTRVPSGKPSGGRGLIYLDSSNKLCFDTLPTGTLL